MLEEARSQLLRSVEDESGAEEAVERAGDAEVSDAPKEVLDADSAVSATAALEKNPIEVADASNNLSLTAELHAADEDASPAKTSKPYAGRRESSADPSAEGEPNIWFEVGKGSAPSEVAASASPKVAASGSLAVATSVSTDTELDTTGISEVSYVSPVASTLVDVKRMLEEAKSTLVSAEGRIDESFAEASAGAVSSFASSSVGGSPRKSGRPKEMQLHPTSYIGDEKSIASRSPGRSPRRRQEESFTTRSSPGRVSASFVNVFDENEGAEDLSLSFASGSAVEFSGLPSMSQWETAPLEVVSSRRAPTRIPVARIARAPAARTAPTAFTIDVTTASEKEKAEKRARLARLSESRARSLQNRHARTAVAIRRQRELEADKDLKRREELERSKRPYGHRTSPEWSARAQSVDAGKHIAAAYGRGVARGRSRRTSEKAAPCSRSRSESLRRIEREGAWHARAPSSNRVY